jgi:hypothetical protein
LALIKDLADFYMLPSTNKTHLTLLEAIDIIIEIAKKNNLQQKQSTWNFNNKKMLSDQIKNAWKQWKFGSFKVDMALTRIQFAQLFDATINPFELQEIDHNGEIKSIY